MTNLRARIFLTIASFGFCHAAPRLEAQDPLPEPAAISPAALTPNDFPTAPTVEELPSGDSLTPPREPSPVPLGSIENTLAIPSDPPRWHVHVRLESSVTFDDNIFIQPRQKQSDVYFGVTPLLAAGWGTFQADPSTVTGGTSRFPQVAAREGFGNSFLFRYAPTATFFVHHSDQDSFNHDVMLGGRWSADKLTLDMAGRFQTLSAPNIDIGNRVDSQITTGFVNANYQFTGKTSLDARFALEHDSYQGGLDSTDASVVAVLNYQILPKTMAGIGAGFGYTTVQDGKSQYYEQGLLHLRYLPTGKISVEATAGIEVRQTVHGPTHTGPVLEFAATYAAAEATIVRLSVSRRTETSALYSEQDVERTTIEGSIRQRFFEKLFVTLSGGFQHLEYIDAGTAATRTDNFPYVGIESAMEITKWLSMRAGYRYQDNSSSIDDFSFRRNLADLQFNIQF